MSTVALKAALLAANTTGKMVVILALQGITFYLTTAIAVLHVKTVINAAAALIQAHRAIPALLS